MCFGGTVLQRQLQQVQTPTVRMQHLEAQAQPFRQTVHLVNQHGLATLGQIMTRSPQRSADQTLVGVIGPTSDLPFTPADVHPTPMFDMS